MATYQLVCPDVNFDATTGACSQTAWVLVQDQQSVFPPLTVDDGATLGIAILIGLVAIWASKLPRRGL